MISTNFSQTIKTTLIIKNTKVSDYGKGGEIMPRGIKAKYYSYFPTKFSKFVRVSSIEVDWIPTLSHLLSTTKMSLIMKDNRASSDLKSTSCLFSMKRKADESWKLSIDLSLFFPLTEIRSGLPLSFDVELSSSHIKPNKEIGRLIFHISFLSAQTAGKSSIGKTLFTYASDRPVDDEDKEESLPAVLTIESVNDIARRSISEYLNGNYDVYELRRKLVETMGVKNKPMLTL